MCSYNVVDKSKSCIRGSRQSWRARTAFGLPSVASLAALVLAAGCGGDDNGTAGGIDAGSNQDAGKGAGDGGVQGRDATSPSDALSPLDTGTPVEAGDPGTVDITFDVATNKNVHPISPLVYGTNGADTIAKTHQSMTRMGGNRMTAFNWENNASNAGSDYQFENDDYLCSNAMCMPTNDTPGALIKGFVDQANANGAAVVLTIPIVDYVAADKTPAGDVRNSGANYLSTRFKQNKPTKGSAFANPPDVTDAFVYEDEFVNWLKATEPSANIILEMDNEPDLWSSTHAEVHPAAVTYAELASRNVKFASAVKSVWPQVKVSGPVSYGWQGYVTLQNASDSTANGDFVEYYLDAMKAAGGGASGRLVDYLDLHWYPEATGGGERISGPQTDAAIVAAREQAPRSLWDTSYKETSWIVDSIMQPIQLIPRMQAKIAAHYPGTGLAITEWNYGGGTDISGAIASADVLGIFGRDGVDAASMWPLNGTESFTYAAFRAYRNYDGAGKQFGDTSISATTSDVPNSSVYASLDSTNVSRLVIVAINKSTSIKTAGIKVEASTVYTKASVFTLTSAGADLVSAAGLTSVATNAFRYPMPPQSISVIVPNP